MNAVVCQITEAQGPAWDRVQRRVTYDADTKEMVCDEEVRSLPGKVLPRMPPKQNKYSH